MAGVAPILLDQVKQEPTETRPTSVWPLHVDELAQATIGERRLEVLAGLFDRTVPQLVERVSAVTRGRGEHGAFVYSIGIPRVADR